MSGASQLPCTAAGSDLQAALTQIAAAADGTPDVLYLGTGSYLQDDLTWSGSDALRIEGAPGGSNITRTPGANKVVFRANGGELQFSGVTIVVPNGGDQEIGISNGSNALSGARVTADAAATRALGIGGGGTVSAASITMPPDGTGWGGTSSSVLRDSVIDAGTGVIVRNASPVTPARVSRVRIRAVTGLATLDGYLNVDDTVVDLTSANSTGLFATAANNNAGATANFVTIVGNGSNPQTGVLARSATAYTSGVQVSNSIISGVLISLKRDTTPVMGVPPGMATANISISYSDYDPGTAVATGGGQGTTTAGDGNVNAAPQFASPAHDLLQSSPLVDAGNPTAQPGDPTADVVGEPRAADGHGGCTLRPDIGAYEFQPSPGARASASAATVGVGEPAGFDASASTDPTAACPTPSGLSYAWSFDDGGSATGASVSHAFGSPGTHSGTVTVTSLFNQTTSRATVTVEVLAPAPPTSAAPTGPALSSDSSSKDGGAVPSAPAFTGVGLPAKKLRLVKGRLTVPLECPARAVGACEGRLVLTAKLSKGKRLKLGTLTFTIKPGRRVLRSLAVRRSVARQLKGNKGLALIAKLSSADARGQRVSASKALRLTR